MFNPLKVFKKKEPEEEITLPIPQESREPLTQSSSSLDKEDLIISKLETINAKLDNIEERLKKIEEIASS